MSSQIFDWKQFGRHLFSPVLAKLDRSVHKTGPQTSKTSESTANLSLAERWTITEIRRQF